MALCQQKQLFLLWKSPLKLDVYKRQSLFWSVFLAIGLTIASLILAGKFGGRVPLLKNFHDNVIGEKSSGRAFLLTYVVIYVISFCLLFAPLHAYYNVSYYRYNDTIYANTRHSWYEYEDYGYGGDYEKVSKSSIPDDVLANKTDYQFNYNDDSEWTSSFTEFEDSSYYDEHYTCLLYTSHNCISTAACTV